MSDLLFSLIVVPVSLVYLHLQSWVNTEAVVASITCKVTPYLADVSLLVSVQSLVVVAVDCFVAVAFHLRCLSSHFKTMSFVYRLAMGRFHVGRHSTSRRQHSIWIWRKVPLCNQLGKEVLGHGMSIADFYLGFATLFIYFPSALLILLYATIFTKLKSQKIAGQGATLSVKDSARKGTETL